MDMIKFVLALFLLKEVNGFLPNRLSAIVPGDFTHEDITQIGILSAVECLISKKNCDDGFIDVHSTSASPKFDVIFKDEVSRRRFDTAVEEIVHHNNLVGKEHHDKAVWHFNGEQIREGHEKLQELRHTLLQILTSGVTDYKAARAVTGQYLHMVQTFYSNTNWIEIRGTTENIHLGMPGHLMVPVVPEDMDTCSSCRLQFCKDNLLTEQFLTSGFREGQDITKPTVSPNDSYTGKCSHGGRFDASGTTTAALGGINKESRDPTVSPHYHLHEFAARAAMSHTKLFFSHSEHGLMSVIDSKTAKKLLGIDSRGHRLAMVIDKDIVTRNDMQSLQRTMAEQDHNVTERNLTIVLFSQSGIEISFGKLNTDSKNLQERRVCNTCLLEALKQAYRFLGSEGKIILVSGSLKDETEYSTPALSALLSNNVPIYVVCLQCYSNGTIGAGSKPNLRKRSTIKPSMSIYTTIASVTGGTVYHSDHNHVKDVIAVMKETVTTFPPITIKKFKMTSGAGSSFVVPIDENVREFNLKIEGTSSSSVSGSTAIYVIQPNGTKFTFSGNNTRKMLGLQLVVMKVVNPSPGIWKVRRRITDTWQVECTGKSFLDFTYKLMQPGPGGFGEYPLIGRPIAGENTSILVTVAKYDIVNSIDKAILIDGNGIEVQNISLHNVGGRRGKSLFKGIMTVPVKEFRIAISGKDKHNNIFLRLNPIMISTLAIKLEVFPASGTLYKNENITIPYRVSNVGGGSTGVEIAISDDLNFAQSPKSRHATIRSHGSVNGTFILVAGNKKGETTTVSISAKADGASSNKVQFRVQRITVDEHIVKKVDKIPPTCNVTAVHGKCDFGADICACSNMTWSMEVETGDVGFGLLGVFASAASVNHTFTKDSFSAGHTVDKGKIKARLSDDCCHQLAKITVVDLAGLVAQCNVTITPNFIPPNPKLCLPDIPTTSTTTTTTTTTTTRPTTTRKPLPSNFTGSTTTTTPGPTTTPTTTTSTTTLPTTTPVHITCTKTSQTDCDLRSSCLTGPVACSNMNWTMKATLSRNGIGRYFTIPKNAGRNAKLTYKNYALILTTDCCHPSAIVRFADIAGNIGQCDGNPTVQKDTKPLNCTRSISCKAKSVGTCDLRTSSCASTGSTCRTSAAPPNCHDRHWIFNATFGTEGFGNYIVTPSSNSSFSQKTKTYSASTDCCKTSMTLTAVDARNNTGSCTVTATVLTDTTTSTTTTSTTTTTMTTMTTATTSSTIITNPSSQGTNKAIPQTKSKSEEKSSSVPIGAIAGGVGGIVGIGLIATVVVVIRKKLISPKSVSQDPSETEITPSSAPTGTRGQ